MIGELGETKGPKGSIHIRGKPGVMLLYGFTWTVRSHVDYKRGKPQSVPTELANAQRASTAPSQ